MALPAAILDDRASCFWDVDTSTLDPHLHRDFIIGRVLTRGGLRSVRALVDWVGEDDLREFVRSGSVHRLDARTLRFWRLILGVETAPCTKKSSLPRRVATWPH